jgi:hypothetical protein
VIYDSGPVSETADGPAAGGCRLAIWPAHTALIAGHTLPTVYDLWIISQAKPGGRVWQHAIAVAKLGDRSARLILGLVCPERAAYRVETWPRQAPPIHATMLRLTVAEVGPDAAIPRAATRELVEQVVDGRLPIDPPAGDRVDWAATWCRRTAEAVTAATSSPAVKAARAIWN